MSKKKMRKEFEKALKNVKTVTAQQLVGANPEAVADVVDGIDYLSEELWDTGMMVRKERFWKCFFIGTTGGLLYSYIRDLLTKEKKNANGKL